MRLHSITLCGAVALALAGSASPAFSQGSEAQALVNAVRFGRPTEVRALLARGADPDVRVDDPAGGNAVNVAFTAMNGMALLGRTDEPDPGRHAAALDVLRALVERTPALDLAVRIGPRDVTPLMLAAESGAVDVVRVLLDGGANPNATNGGRYTALDFAVDRPPIWSTSPAADRAEIVQLLLAKGARADRAGADGVKPAARARRAGRTDIAALIEGR
jgi:hypothetical protein